MEAGTAETLFADTKTFADQTSEMHDDRLSFYEISLAPHDVVLVHQTFGTTDELELRFNRLVKL